MRTTSGGQLAPRGVRNRSLECSYETVLELRDGLHVTCTTSLSAQQTRTVGPLDSVTAPFHQQTPLYTWTVDLPRVHADTAAPATQCRDGGRSGADTAACRPATPRSALYRDALRRRPPRQLRTGTGESAHLQARCPTGVDPRTPGTQRTRQNATPQNGVLVRVPMVNGFARELPEEFIRNGCGIPAQSMQFRSRKNSEYIRPPNDPTGEARRKPGPPQRACQASTPSDQPCRRQGSCSTEAATG
ncbi:hypothetical protein SCOCK_60185 [Actinacidiphila cocklensis]|uniref:Uncharacterized protein n=1 Tax=Actinacidiphila cocklensis TaxID=887465 RepID=A0A9W4DWU1_9ACTN|nr:hypothetical protein SCOCK_60185 [Actinacidiphila cocklensis]